MTQQMSFDPFALWKQMYDKAEEQWSQTMDETMRKEEFSNWMGQCLNGYLQYQDLTRKSTEKYLEQANMPSRQDLANLASIVINIEEKIENLGETIEENVLETIKQSDTSKEIKALKNDVSKLSKKIDIIVELLHANLEASPTQSNEEQVGSTANGPETDVDK